MLAEKLRVFSREKTKEVDSLSVEISETRQILVGGDIPTWRRVELEKKADDAEIKVLTITRLLTELNFIVCEEEG